MRAGVALGSNLGDRLANLREAKRRVGAIAGVAGLLASSIYETEAVGCEPGAADFLNAVIDFDYSGDAAELLAELRAVEAQLGRPNEHARNRSRTIDLDLLYFAEMQRNDPELQLPHPRMFSRRFVLEPLAELRPELLLPGQRQTIRELLNRLPETPEVLRLTSGW